MPMENIAGRNSPMVILSQGRLRAHDAHQHC
jgi:hypothetical protein